MRNRDWVLAGVLVAAVVAAGVIAGRGRSGGVARPRVGFGSQVRKLAATSRLIYTNGWVASSGQQAIGVYAGRQAVNPRNGLFVIVRQTRAGHRRDANVIVPGSGSVTLLRPAPPQSQRAAFTATLHFVTANGGTGTLSLGEDSVSVSR